MPSTYKNVQKCSAKPPSSASIFPDILFVSVLGNKYLKERYYLEDPSKADDLDFWFNFGISFVFYGGMLLANFIVYNFPLPSFVKAKFRE